MSPRSDGAKEKAKAKGSRCPVCGRARDEKFRPFCSKRCADTDLARWLEGSYAIPGEASEEGEGQNGDGQEKS